MGDFVEPVGGGDEILNPVPKVFTQKFFESVIQKSIGSGEINKDDRLVFIAAADENGAKAIVAVNLLNKEDIKIKMSGIFEYDWDGDNKAGAKVIFSVK